jgi:anthranilate phosphoribosyltransferase
MIQADARTRRGAPAELIEKKGRRLPKAKELDREEARELLGAMLDRTARTHEINALLRAYRLKGETVAELAGFVSALDERLARFDAAPDKPRPVVLPSYAGVRRKANLTALLALLLRRYGVPVLLHGTADAARHFGRVTTVAVLRELGIEPASSVEQARQTLLEQALVFVPIDVLAPAFGSLFRAHEASDRSAAALARLVDPFRGAGFRVIGVTRLENLARMRAFLEATRGDALLLRGIEGESYADPRRQPQLEWFDKGLGNVLFKAESPRGSLPAAPPGAADACATAAWTASALAGEVPIPQPILNQLACCLHATRRVPEG